MIDHRPDDPDELKTGKERRLHKRKKLRIRKQNRRESKMKRLLVRMNTDLELAAEQNRSEANRQPPKPILPRVNRIVDTRKPLRRCERAWAHRIIREELAMIVEEEKEVEIIRAAMDAEYGKVMSYYC